MASPDRTLSMLARLQRIEEAKPRVSVPPTPLDQHTTAPVTSFLS